jgi:hypothetical protein
VDELRRLIDEAYPELEVIFDGDGHGRGRELHVRNDRGFQCLIRHEADLFKWFGDRRRQLVAVQQPRQRELF